MFKLFETVFCEHKLVFRVRKSTLRWFQQWTVCVPNNPGKNLNTFYMHTFTHIHTQNMCIQSLVLWGFCLLLFCFFLECGGSLFCLVFLIKKQQHYYRRKEKSSNNPRPPPPPPPQHKKQQFPLFPLRRNKLKIYETFIFINKSLK